MAFVPYVELTVARGLSTSITVGRPATVLFTTYGHPGFILTGGLLTEAGFPLLLESGDDLLT